MSVSIGDITGRIVVVDKGTSVVSQFTRNLDVSVKQIQLSGNRLTSAMEGMLSKAALLATAGMVARKGFQFLKESAVEAMEAEKAMAQLRAGVESTGGAAGKSAEELSAMADQLSKLTGFDDELIAGGEAILLTFRRVRGEAFEQTMSLALDLSARFGKSVDSSVIMIAKALDQLMAGSTKGLSALSKAGVVFTDQQKKQMEQLVRTGQAAEAQRMFFKELEAQFGGSAVAARDTLGGALGALGVAWSNLKETIGTSGTGIRIIIEGMIQLVERFTAVWQRADLGVTIVLLGLNEMVGALENRLQSLLVTLLRVSARATQANPFASDEQKIRAQVGLNNAIIDQARKRVGFAERSRNLEAEINQKTMALLGILPKVKAGYSDVGDEIEKAKSKQKSWFDDLYANLARQTQALKLFQQGMPIKQIENLVSAAEGLGKTNLLDGLVLKAGVIKGQIDDIANAFRLADEAKKKFADARDDLDVLMGKQFEGFGGNDPEMQRLLANLRAQKQLTDSVATDEERRLATIQEVLRLGIEGETLQRIVLANNEEWNVGLSQTQILFERINERLGFVAEGIAFDLVSNWRRAWEENESITDATIDTLRDSMLNVLQDIISQWLAQWFKAMAAWLARWIATQAAAKTAQAGLGNTGGMAGGIGGGGMFSGAASGASGAGVSTSAMMGAGLAAFGLYVIYKGFIEDHERKFARVTISNGAIGSIESHGKKYLDGVSSAAESILANLETFLGEINVTMERLGTVIIESSKAGWNVAIPGSTGKLFKSMEEAISYSQVLMLKYGEFAESVSLLVRSVIQSTKAVNMEQLASDIDFANVLDTQNLEQAAASMAQAMDTAMSQWKRAEDLFLSFYSTNLPAFEAAVGSIVTKLSTSLQSVYIQLAGIEEDPKAAWERQRVAYNAQRAIVLAQLKLWELEIAARIANYNAQATLIGGGPRGGGGKGGGEGKGAGGGIIGMAMAMLQAADIVNGAAASIDHALQALLDIQAQLIAAQGNMPPPLNPEDYKPNRGRGGGKGNKGQLADLREQLMDEIAAMVAESKGPLHSAFNDLQNNLESFRERAKEAKLPAAELARGVELLTAAFRKSVRQQAEDYAGINDALSARLQEVEDFFAEVRALGETQTGLSSQDVAALESAAIAEIGRELITMIDEFAGLIDPMAAIESKANELTAGLMAFAEAAGWSAEQIADAQALIEAGVSLQRQQGINSLLDKLFGYLKQAGVHQKEALEFERRKALTDVDLLEAQLRFYGALTSQTEEWIDAARVFIKSTAFGDGADDDIKLNPEWLARQTASIVDVAAEKAAEALEEAARKLAEDIERATSLLTRYQRDEMDPLARRLLEINEDFAEIKRVLGDTPEVLAAHNAAITKVTKEASDRVADEIASNLRSMISTWRGAVEQLAQSTKDLLTDETFTNLTQEHQLETARVQLAQLAVKAQAGDLEALANLDAARREFLSELRESEGGGFGYDTGFEWAMKQTAAVLANAQTAESSMIATELAKTTAVWGDIMERLTDDLNATFYDAVDNVVFAIYDAIGSVPAMARGGIVMSGPRLVRVGEYVPEAIVPLSKLANMVPYQRYDAGHNRMSDPMGYQEKDTMDRLSSVERTNREIATALSAIKADINTMRRSRQR